MPTTAVYTDAPIHVLVSGNDFMASNVGHALYDFLVPAFNIMHLFHMYSPRFQLLLHSHGGEKDAAMDPCTHTALLGTSVDLVHHQWAASPPLYIMQCSLVCVCL